MATHIEEPNIEWAAVYNNPFNLEDGIHSVVVDKSGNIYVIGSCEVTSNNGVHKDFLIIKYSQWGEELWATRYNGPANSTDHAVSLALDDLDFLYVTGYSEGLGTGMDITTIKFDYDGNVVWESRYSGAGANEDLGSNICVDTLGNVYVVGASVGVDSDYDYVTIAYDEFGAEKWIDRYNGEANGYDFGRDITVDSEGHIFVTGLSDGVNTKYDIVTIKYDQAGNRQWINRYDGPGNSYDFGRNVVVDSDGNVYVSGYSSGLGSWSDSTVIKYDNNGIQLWETRYNGPENWADRSNNLWVDKFGFVYITGQSYETNKTSAFATVKYDSLGNEMWAARYIGPGNKRDSSYGLAVDVLGNVYIQGPSYGIESNADITTIKYNSFGNEEWISRYDGPGHGYDYGGNLALDPLGNLYATGNIKGIDSGVDAILLKFGTSGKILLENMVNFIEDLVAFSSLRRGEANSLNVQLENILNILDTQSGAVCNQLNAFVRNVRAYIRTGKLSSIDGQRLIDCTTIVSSILCN